MDYSNVFGYVFLGLYAIAAVCIIIWSIWKSRRIQHIGKVRHQLLMKINSISKARQQSGIVLNRDVPVSVAYTWVLNPFEWMHAIPFDDMLYMFDKNNWTVRDLVIAYYGGAEQVPDDVRDELITHGVEI